MKEDRDIIDVIKKILDRIPNEEKVLRTELIDIGERAHYAAPEDRRRFWVMASNILAIRIPPPPPAGWRAEVIGIFMGEDPEKELIIPTLKLALGAVGTECARVGETCEYYDALGAEVVRLQAGHLIELTKRAKAQDTIGALLDAVAALQEENGLFRGQAALLKKAEASAEAWRQKSEANIKQRIVAEAETEKIKADLTDNLDALSENGVPVIRSREGGGLEDPIASFVLTVSDLHSTVQEFQGKTLDLMAELMAYDGVSRAMDRPRSAGKLSAMLSALRAAAMMGRTTKVMLRDGGLAAVLPWDAWAKSDASNIETMREAKKQFCVKVCQGAELCETCPLKLMVFEPTKKEST